MHTIQQLFDLCDQHTQGADVFFEIIKAAIDLCVVTPDEIATEFGAGSCAAQFWAEGKTKPKPLAQTHIVGWVRQKAGAKK